jgi:hypothetical protein
MTVHRLWQIAKIASRAQDVSPASKRRFTVAKIATKKSLVIIVANEKSVANA